MILMLETGTIAMARGSVRKPNSLQKLWDMPNGKREEIEEQLAKDDTDDMYDLDAGWSQQNHNLHIHHRAFHFMQAIRLFALESVWRTTNVFRFHINPYETVPHCGVTIEDLHWRIASTQRVAMKLLRNTSESNPATRCRNIANNDNYKSCLVNWTDAVETIAVADGHKRAAEFRPRVSKSIHDYMVKLMRNVLHTTSRPETELAEQLRMLIFQQEYVKALVTRWEEEHPGDWHLEAHINGSLHGLLLSIWEHSNAVSRETFMWAMRRLDLPSAYQAVIDLHMSDIKNAATNVVRKTQTKWLHDQCKKVFAQGKHRQHKVDNVPGRQ